MPEVCECHIEVARLHDFFQEWHRGNLQPGDFAQFEDALAPGFTIITPVGQLLERDLILDAVRALHGGEGPDFRIETVARSCQRVRGLHISTYEEHQQGARSTIRLSTAVLSETDGRLVWHAVQETWITS